jgi:O-succinylbenzoic acid--CoA ligase
MKLLDFSKGKLDELDSSIDWEFSIQEFLDQWFSSSEYIEAKTSGSTGEPKPISLPKSAMKMSAKMTGEFFQLQKGDSALLCLPVNFIAGKMMVVRAIELGLKLYCVQPKSQIDLSEFPSLDFVPMTPMQVENSIESLDKINTLLIGGAPLSDVLREKLLSIPTHSFESYGMTETITHIGLKEISEDYFKLLKGVQISKDERGCLVIQTPYFKEPIVTNDLVEIRNSTEFRWLGRVDNVINSGGIKFIPEKMEQKLKSFLSTEFIISSLPDSTLGEKLILVIESSSPLQLDLNNSNLDKYETPKEIHFLTEFPRTESGKIKRGAIRELILAKD